MTDTEALDDFHGLRAAIPRDDQALPLGRTRLHAADSVTRRIGGDVRTLLMAGSTFVMQVAHPVVGAGVAEHSQYRVDPWTRLRDIDASEKRFLWTDEVASREEGARLRRIHRNIFGVMPDGRRYHSLDPHGYGWVHLVFLDTMIRQVELYGDEPLSRSDEARLFLEWYEAALFLGLRERDLPRSLGEYRERYEHALRHEATRTSVVAHLLGDRIGPPRPPALDAVPGSLWRALWRPLGVTSRWLALAGLPPKFRERIHAHHPWSDVDEARHVKVRALIRAVVRRLPVAYRTLPNARRVARAVAWSQPAPSQGAA